MTRSPHIEAEVRAIISDIARQDASLIGSDEDLVERLAVDSLQALQILAGVEQRFDVRLPDEDLVHLRTVGCIADLVQQLQHGGHS